MAGDGATVAPMNQLPVSRLKIEPVATPPGLELLGDIDSHTAPLLEDALREFDQETDLNVDMAKVDFVDSTGLRVLVARHQMLDTAGHRLVLANPSDAVRRLLDITGLSGTLHTSGGSPPPADG